MKYELETLTQYVQSVIRGDADVMKALRKEEERLPKVIIENIFLLKTHYLVRQYICWHLNELVNLADLLYRKAGIPGGNSCKKVLIVILKLLSTLTQEFPEHLDNNIPLPKVLLYRERKTYQNELEALKALLIANRLNVKLIAIALLPFEKFVGTNAGIMVSYSDYKFIKHYVSGLKEINFQATGYEVLDYVLLDKLITLNYNNMRLFEYCTAEFNKYLKKYPAIDEKEKVLTMVKKILNQLPVISGISYDGRFEPIRDVLLKWTDEEMTYQGKFYSGIEQSASLDKRLQKIHLPVPQIALFAFLAQKHGVFYDQDKNAIIHHYIHTYCSKETDRMSEASFRNHFNNKPTDAAARGLRKLLRKMLDDLDDFLS
jgi:hypothetical protein